MRRTKRPARGRARSAGRSAPVTRAEHRSAITRRRSAVALAGSFVVAAIVLVAWFPAGALIDQHRTLASSTSTLAQLRAEDRALRTESKNLSKPSEIARIARQQFDLIVPGEQAYQVLPPPGTTGGATDPYSGDPGSSAPVSPTAAPELPPGTVRASQSDTSSKHATADGHSAANPNSPDLLTRLVHTLEFWR